MEKYYDLIIKPIVTEHSMDLMEEKKYSFVVQKKATKPEIKEAIEKIFGVKVEKVYTQNHRGKLKRQGATQGKRADWKKAIVKLTNDSQSIEFFEGMQ